MQSWQKDMMPIHLKYLELFVSFTGYSEFTEGIRKNISGTDEQKKNKPDHNNRSKLFYDPVFYNRL